jgi:hypothetical protein
MFLLSTVTIRSGETVMATPAPGGKTQIKLDARFMYLTIAAPWAVLRKVAAFVAEDLSFPLTLELIVGNIQIMEF